MKTDSNKVASGQWPEAGVEQLLAEVEHAGRDARRQQELGDMIDRMAGESGKRKVESGRHGFWWWGARVAAAACVLFFIGTAVRVWFIPTGESATVVAEAEVPEVVLPEVVLPAEPTAAVDAKPVVHRGRVKAVAMQPVVEEQVEPVAVEEYFVEETVEEEPPVEEPVEAPVNNQIEVIAQPVVSIAQTVEPTLEKPTPVKPRERKRSFFSSLFRPAEPSLMEGTVLAFNIL
jgi:hypothetical protein